MLLPLWTACDKDIHENDRHGLAVGMEWLEGIEPTDITSPLWIYDAEGHEVEAHEFSSPQELASGLFSLPEGDYTLVGVCGLTEPFRYDYENGTRTADMLRVSLADPSASPAHAVGGVAQPPLRHPCRSVAGRACRPYRRRARRSVACRHGTQCRHLPLSGTARR